MREAYTRTVGASDTYLFDLGAGTDFSKTDIGDLIPAFEAYADKMAAAGFGGNRLLFLLYLDVVAGGGVAPLRHVSWILGRVCSSSPATL